MATERDRVAWKIQGIFAEYLGVGGDGEINGLGTASYKIADIFAAEQARASDHRSTLERGDEIERDFYRLKAQEWACEPDDAKARIVTAIAALDVNSFD